MQRSTIIMIGYLLAALALMYFLGKLRSRLQLSRAKHRSLAGHSRLSRRIAALVPFYEYGESQFFASDAAPPEIAAARRLGFMRLSQLFAARSRKTAEHTAALSDRASDFEFTSRYRVPFQFSRFVREHLKVGAFVESSSGVSVTDLDGNSFHDLTGSYGVNVFGYDFYK
jgi:glutamate-1-semialdehyde 2,1-aminomutase